MIKSMNYLLIYVNLIDQIIVNHGKYQVQCDKILKSCVPKVIPQPWMPPFLICYMLFEIWDFERCDHSQHLKE